MADVLEFLKELLDGERDKDARCDGKYPCANGPGTKLRPRGK